MWIYRMLRPCEFYSCNLWFRIDLSIFEPVDCHLRLNLAIFALLAGRCFCLHLSFVTLYFGFDLIIWGLSIFGQVARYFSSDLSVFEPLSRKLIFLVGARHFLRQLWNSEPVVCQSRFTNLSFLLKPSDFFACGMLFCPYFEIFAPAARDFRFDLVIFGQ